MDSPDWKDNWEVAQLWNFFDTLVLHQLDREWLAKRFPIIPIPNWEFNIWTHVYETFIFSRLSGVLIEWNYWSSELDMFIEWYLDAVLVTVRAMLRSSGITLNSETGLEISNAFAKLKEDLSEALELYPVWSYTTKALGTFRKRVGKLSQ